VKIRVLGSAAGGGFPQWNCNCPNCSGVRRGTIRAQPRTQSSIAVSADGANWVLINASPDILTQIKAAPVLQPARALRDTGIRAIILVDSQVDHTTGLLMLREGGPLEIYCTDTVQRDLTEFNPIFSVLGHYCGINHHSVPLADGAGFDIDGIGGLGFAAVPVTSKGAPYSPGRHDADDPGNNIGLVISDTASGRSVFYSPGLAAVDGRVRDHMARADCVMVDGTFWTDDEMVRLGVSKKYAHDIGHLPQSGAGGMIDVLAPLTARKILIHINNTNPILDEASPQRAELAHAGIEVSYDGMEIEL
jgi:pyrroloquinoline quinone biosynthesis protein B